MREFITFLRALICRAKFATTTSSNGDILVIYEGKTYAITVRELPE